MSKAAAHGRALLVAAAVLIGGAAGIAQAGSVIINVDPTGTYLQGTDAAHPATVIVLADYASVLDLTQPLRFEVTAPYQDGILDPDDPNTINPVDTALAAFTAGEDPFANPSAALPTFNADSDPLDYVTGGLPVPGDVEWDFGFGSLGINVIIPTGATMVYFSADDFFFADNSGPFQITLSTLDGVSQPVGAPLPGTAGAGAGLLAITLAARRFRRRS